MTSGQSADGGPLHVIAELVAKSGEADHMRALLSSFAEGARKEPGCLSYVLLEVDGEAGRFMTTELWADHAAIEAHMGTPQIKAALPILGPMLAKPFTQIVLNAVRS